MLIALKRDLWICILILVTSAGALFAAPRRALPPAAVDEPSSPSIQETLDYLNARVSSTFVPSNVNSVPGKFSLSNDRRTIWWSRWQSLDLLMSQSRDAWPWAWMNALGTCGGGMEGHSGVLVNDLDAESITFDPQSGKVLMAAKYDSAWQFWGQCGDGFEQARKGLLQTDTKSSNAKLLGGQKAIGISTNKDSETAERFVRALRHLLRLMQTLPENQNTGQKDPFAQ